MTGFIAAFHDINYDLVGMRGKMSSNCLWHACQALFVGLLLFSIGAIMSILGFHADGLLDPNNNSTEEITYDLYNDRTNVRFSKLSYAGPIVMGVGGFIIVATCVMTFEARDNSSKVGPASYTGARTVAGLYTNTYRARTRSLDVRSVGSQTMAESTTTSSSTALHIFDKKALLETFRKFSRTIRTGSTCKEEEDQFHRSPSAPNLLATEGLTGKRIPSAATTASTARRSSVLPKLKSRAPPSLKQLRQTMSVDYKSSSPFIVPGALPPPPPPPTTGGEASVSGNVSGVSSSGHAQTCKSCSDVGGGDPGKASSSSCIQIRSSKSRNCKFNRKGMGSSADNNFCSSPPSQQQPDGEVSTNSVPPNDEVQCSTSSSSQICVNSSSMDNTDKASTSGPQTQTRFRRCSNPNFHFEPATVELHEPHKVATLNNGPSSSGGGGGEVGNSSCSPLRILQPSPRGERTVRICEKNRSTSMAVAGSGGRTRPILRSELSCRPMLMRQSRVDHCEIISVPDTDDDDEPIIEEESSAAV